jgi:hypothetical protein
MINILCRCNAASCQTMLAKILVSFKSLNPEALPSRIVTDTITQLIISIRWDGNFLYAPQVALEYADLTKKKRCWKAFASSFIRRILRDWDEDAVDTQAVPFEPSGRIRHPFTSHPKSFRIHWLYGWILSAVHNEVAARDPGNRLFSA